MEEKLSLPLVPAVRAGDTIYLSGQVGFQTWGVLVEGGIEEQTRQTLLNIQSVLEAEGAGPGDLVKLTAWITDASLFAGFNHAYTAFFRGLAVPARTTVVSALAIPGSLVEIDGIAAIGRRQ